MSFQRDEYFEIREYVENNNPDAAIPKLAELFAAEYRIRHKEGENSPQMNELLKRSECDIYNDPNVSEEGISKFAEVIAADKSIALNEYFDLFKFSSKFCWLNYLNIMEKLPEEDKIRGLPILFELLQDPNWPTYKKTMSLFDKMDKKVIDPYLKKYLAQAYAEDDEMWINNLEHLAGTRKNDLDVSERMRVPKEPTYPTPEMEQCLYESFEALARVCLKHDFDKTGLEGIKDIEKRLYENKGKEFEEVKGFLIEMAALYTKVLKDELGGNLVFVNNMCILDDVEGKIRKVSPLVPVFAEWMDYRNGKSYESEEGLMLSLYRQIKAA